MTVNDAGIYVHVPFCVRKCRYCAFLSSPASEEAKEEYVRALVSEAELCRETDMVFDTVYFGGGTPSVLSAEMLDEIMSALKRNYRISQGAEMTIEVNPGTLGTSDDEILKTLKEYRKIGFNRLSMGVQSMDDGVLEFIGRIHRSEDVIRDFRLARQAGFSNISLDLMLSLPDPPGRNDSAGTAIGSLRQLIALNPEHISCYSLQLEEGTEFDRMYRNGEIEEISDEEDRRIYHEVVGILREAGYEHYEISNFARTDRPGKAPGFGDATPSDASPYRSRHNSKYWSMTDYLGLGLGAGGFVKGIRYANMTDRGEYCEAAAQGERPAAERHPVTKQDSIGESIFTGLRRREGIRFDDIKGCEDFAVSGREMLDEAETFVKSGHLLIDENGMRLTEEGIDISNAIMSIFV